MTNTLNIPQALLDRMEVIRLSGYTENEKLMIAKKYLVPKQVKETGLKSKEINVADSAIVDIIRYYTREAGVRNLEREISKLSRKSLKSIIIDKKKKISISKRNLENFSGNLEITVNKISSVGDPYNQTFQTNVQGQSGISIPGTQDKSGPYKIASVPFGEFEILISESGGTTDTTSCDVVQTVIIPEITPLIYTGDLQFQIDPCEKEVEIEAIIEGGQPFVSPNGDTFYRYQWILTTANNEIFNYSGKNIIVRDAGNLQLKGYDSSGCEYTLIDQSSPIEINERISPYRLEPRLNNNTDFALEPSCDNPLRDNGQINFEVVGGDLPQGGQYPYEIIWEKFAN